MHQRIQHLEERDAQWTLSLPIPVRFCLGRDGRLLYVVLASSSGRSSPPAPDGEAGARPGPSNPRSHPDDRRDGALAAAHPASTSRDALLS